MKELQALKVMGRDLPVMRGGKNMWLNITTFLRTNAG